MLKLPMDYTISTLLPGSNQHDSGEYEVFQAASIETAWLSGLTMIGHNISNLRIKKS